MSDETYFSILNETLKSYKRAIPFLVIDMDRLDANIQALKNSLNPENDFRIVVKSLPSFDLINYIMRESDTQKLMVFHQPFLSDLSSKLDNTADILMGKPMPVKSVEYFYKNPVHSATFDPYKQIQWLVDSSKRLEEYVFLAKSIGQNLRLNLEIDVGLHRGGFPNLEKLNESLNLVQANLKHVTFSGLMGYDPHVVKLPGIVRSQDKAMGMATTFYNDCKNLIRTRFPDLWNESLTFNGGGSPTLSLHNQIKSPINDLAVGSCLVKPSSFDIPTLEEYLPACFIASPVLKKFDGTNIPGLENVRNLLQLLKPNYKKSYFIYGGYWKADYHFPIGLMQNKLFGSSTNQTMVNAPANTKLEVDDFIFLRPQQSEFVLLQFGNILAYRNGKIVDEWELLKQV